MKHRTTQFLAVPALAALLAVCVASAVPDAAPDPVTRRDAARLQAKIDRINKNATERHGDVQTPVSEAELNSYLQYELGDKLPAGVKDPWVSILGDGRVSGRATVDLSEVSKNRKASGGMLDPYSYLTGSVPVQANGVLKSKDGVASFVLESASVSGVPVPVWMLQDIVTSYSKSPESPQGVALDKPFALPAGIREIQIARGQAIVIQ
jgi:hypothetical protein